MDYGMLVFGIVVAFLVVVVFLFGGVGRPDLNEEYYLSLTTALEARKKEKEKEDETRKS